MEGELKKTTPVEKKIPGRGRSRRRSGVPSSTEEIINGFWDRARYGSYFECLGIPEDAGTSDVREAWVKLSGMLGKLRASATDNPEWLFALDQVAKVGADAFEVLSDPDLRLTYVRALV